MYRLRQCQNCGPHKTSRPLWRSSNPLVRREPGAARFLITPRLLHARLEEFEAIVYCATQLREPKAVVSRSSMASSHRYSTACFRTESRTHFSMTITIKSSHCYPVILRHRANDTGSHISRRKCSRTLWQKQNQHRLHHVTRFSDTRLLTPRAPHYCATTPTRSSHSSTHARST